MMFFINNDDWYIVLLVAGGVFLGKIAYSILQGVLRGIFKSFAKESKEVTK